MKNKPVYSKYFTRDFTLPLIETWGRAETTDPRQWTKKVNPALPYQVFIREKGMVTDYLNLAGLKWVKGELQRLMDADKNYVKYVVAEFNKRIKLIKPVWEKRKALKREELVLYLNRLRGAWAWFEAVWWIMEISDPKSNDFKITKKARVQTELMVTESEIIIRKSLKKIYPELDDLIQALSVEEINLNKLPSKQELKKRIKKYSYANAELFTGKGVAEMEKIFKIKISEPDAKKTTQLKGQTAYSGVAKGKVRILWKLADTNNLKKGEILVSPMTMPGYIPAMKKSTAIITDEGGITSHAAIIAREMRKPCIIGTKIATKVLKDGDLVEVDADSGVVRILKKFKHK